MICLVLLWWISSLLYGYWDLCWFWLYYITIRLNYHVSIFKSMGVAANEPHPLYDITPRAPLLKIFRNHPCVKWCDGGVKDIVSSLFLSKPLVVIWLTGGKWRCDYCSSIIMGALVAVNFFCYTPALINSSTSRWLGLSATVQTAASILARYYSVSLPLILLGDTCNLTCACPHTENREPEWTLVLDHALTTSLSNILFRNWDRHRVYINCRKFYFSSCLYFGTWITRATPCLPQQSLALKKAHVRIDANAPVSLGHRLEGRMLCW